MYVQFWFFFSSRKRASPVALSNWRTRAILAVRGKIPFTLQMMPDGAAFGLDTRSLPARDNLKSSYMEPLNMSIIESRYMFLIYNIAKTKPHNPHLLHLP